MKIAVMMSVWCQNLWDELILKNEIKLLKEKYWNDTKFKVFTYDVNDIFYIDSSVEYLEYFPIWIKNPKNLFRNLKNYYNFIKTIKWSDKVVIGWGWIMFDNETGNYSNPLNQWLFRTEIIKMLKKEIIIFWVSIDIKHNKNLEKIKKIFSNAKEVFVRDNASFELLQNLWIHSEIILDPVFSDNWEVWLENYKKNYLLKKVEAKSFCLDDLIWIDFNWKKVWLALRSWYLWNPPVLSDIPLIKGELKGDWEKELINEIIEFILNSGWKVILLPHSFHTSDDVANDLKFLSQFIKPWIEITSSIKKTYEIYTQKKIDFCLSMRLHSMILSQVYGINFIAIKYAKKSDLM